MNTTVFRVCLLALIAVIGTGIVIANDTANVSAPGLVGTTPEPSATVENTPTPLVPHCQVPCGVYADQMRFEQMLEDTTTIAKGITAINDFAAALGNGAPTGKSINQVNRWVQTKEAHATNTQKIVAEYFLTQRIKESNKDYSSQLITAHKVMVAAMKCKQDADPATAENLKKAILDLYRAYEGKEPNFDHKEK